MESARAGVKVVSRWQAGRVRRGSRALSAVFREPPRESATGGVCAVSSAGGRVDASPCPRGAVRLAVPSPLIPFVDPLPLPRRLLAHEHGDRLVVATGTAVHRFPGV